MYSIKEISHRNIAKDISMISIDSSNSSRNLNRDVTMNSLVVLNEKNFDLNEEIIGNFKQINDLTLLDY